MEAQGPSVVGHIFSFLVLSWSIYYMTFGQSQCHIVVHAPCRSEHALYLSHSRGECSPSPRVSYREGLTGRGRPVHTADTDCVVPHLLSVSKASFHQWLVCWLFLGHFKTVEYWCLRAPLQTSGHCQDFSIPHNGNPRSALVHRFPCPTECLMYVC